MLKTILSTAAAGTLILATSMAHGEDRVGPFEIDAPRDAGKLGLGFASQLRGQVDGVAVAGEDHDITPSVNFARLRLSLRGRFLHDESLRMGFQANLLPGALEVLDVWSQYNFHEQAQVRAGMYKIPFTVHRAQSFSTLVLTDWGTATRHFGAERQMGLMVNNFGAGRLRYAFGVFMGENMRGSFTTPLTRYYGETTVNPSDLTALPGLEEPHPELVGQLGWGSEDIDLGSNSDAKGGGFRYHINASGTFDVQPTVARDMMARAAGEILMKFYGVSINAVFYAGFAELSEEGPLQGTVPAMFGPQAEIAYRPIDMVEVAARYALVMLTEDFRNDARGRADELISEAGQDELAVLTTQYEGAGRTQRVQEISGGLNLYFIGHSLKWQTDGGLFSRVFADVDFNDWRVRTQLQLAF